MKLIPLLSILLVIVFISACVKSAPSAPVAELTLSFSKTNVVPGDSLNITLAVKNVGSLSFNASKYVLVFTTKEKIGERIEHSVLQKISIQGPIPPQEKIEKFYLLPIPANALEGEYNYELSFEEIVSEEPWRSLVIKTTEAKFEVKK